MDPGAIVELSESELVLMKRERQFSYPTLHLEHLGRVWEYYVPLRVNEEWRRGWTFLIQVDSDLAIRIEKPEAKRPVPIAYSQPEGWPLTTAGEVVTASKDRRP